MAGTNGSTGGGGAVLVTGCSSGIGRAVALGLAARGYRVFAGVRCAEVGAGLDSSGSGQIQHLLLDVTDDGQLESAVHTVHEAAGGALLALVNNAGVGLPAAVELSSPDEVRRLLEVNTLGPLRLTQACLPMLREGVRRHGRGRVVNVSSLNGTLALPMVGAYSASKFALEALTDTMRVELRPWGIRLSTVRPGQVRTPIFDKARKELAEQQSQIPDHLRDGYAELYRRAGRFNERGGESATKPEHVAEAVRRALEARWPRPYYTVGWDARGLQWLRAGAGPRMFDRIMARVMGTLKRVD
ncbi:MAG: SDR family oxidoreductase [Planctomycetota bacterium]